MNRSKAKGTAFESAVVAYLQEHGFPLAERRALAGKDDRGDVAGIPGWTIEAKATKELDLPGAVDEAAWEAGNAKTYWFAAIVKRRNRSVADAYAVLPLRLFCALLDEIRNRRLPSGEQ